jgi:hypothetical protein
MSSYNNIKKQNKLRLKPSRRSLNIGNQNPVKSMGSIFKSMFYRPKGSIINDDT